MIFDIRFKWEASRNIGMGDYAGWNVDSSGDGYKAWEGDGEGDGVGDGYGDGYGDGEGNGAGSGIEGWHMIGDGLSLGVRVSNLSNAPSFVETYR